MKSITFRNLVLGFYFCVGCLLVGINYEIFQEQSKDNVVDILPIGNLIFAFLVTLPFFIGVISCLFNRKVWIFNVLYFSSVLFIYLLTETLPNLTLITIGCFIITILLFFAAFAQHPHFFQSNSFSKNSDTILDKFEENHSENIKQKASFLRIHRIFSFAFISIGIGILILSTQTGGHISVDKGLGLTFLGFVLLGFAAFLWKYPKIASWVVALVCLGIFLVAEFSLITEELINPLSLKWFHAILGMFFWGIFLFLAFIAISKTAKEEWKMK